MGEPCPHPSCPAGLLRSQIRGSTRHRVLWLAHPGYITHIIKDAPHSIELKKTSPTFFAQQGAQGCKTNNNNKSEVGQELPFPNEVSPLLVRHELGAAAECGPDAGVLEGGLHRPVQHDVAVDVGLKVLLAENKAAVPGRKVAKSLDRQAQEKDLEAPCTENGWWSRSVVLSIALNTHEPTGGQGSARTHMNQGARATA